MKTLYICPKAETCDIKKDCGGHDVPHDPDRDCVYCTNYCPQCVPVQNEQDQSN